MVIFPVFIVVAFLSGSIPFGWIFSRKKGVDIRSVGSGNIGATNVSRALGLRWGIIVFLLDALKGYLPVVIARSYLQPQETWIGWVALASVAGHMFSPWLKFRGGKGVATAFGAFLALEPWVAIMALGTFLLVLGLFSYVALASITAALSFVIYMKLLYSPSSSMFVAALITVLLIFIRHESNIRRMIQGQEDRVRWSRASSEG